MSRNHCSFVLLAEFHTHEGAQLKYQFPQPLGVDESVLAHSMLPDGAENQLDDWTIFFLNQTPFNTISPVLALDSPEAKSVSLPDEDDGEREDKPDLMCVLNLVRTNYDEKWHRGAKVLALAICTRHPFIQIFKPVLLMALDDYLMSPSQDCLARLFDAVNNMDLSGAPKLTRHEKLVMRASERKDIFAERFTHTKPVHHPPSNSAVDKYNHSQSLPGMNKKPLQHRPTNSTESYSSFEEGLMMRSREKERGPDDNRMREFGRERADSGTTAASVQQHQHQPHQPQQHHSTPSDSSFSLGGSAVWVGDESGLDLNAGDAGTVGGDSGSVVSLAPSSTLAGSNRKRRSTDASSSSSHIHLKDQHLRPAINTANSYYDTQLRPGFTKDTHFFHTNVAYKDHLLPIKMPLSTFSEEVGDYSLITLIKVFSSQQLLSGPLHPHLHTNGPQTHPIIILFNALVTGKRIIFLGHKRPAGEVSSFVLSACALGSGCGVVLRGFIERAFPYANLNNKDEWESVPAYIAGVTNPIFQSSGNWDLLLDISTGTVTVTKDIHANHPVMLIPGVGAPLISRTGTVKAESSFGSEDDIGRSKDGAKADFVAKADHNADNLFIEDIRSAIDYHYGEGLVRVRFTEYVTRFVRLASRYEEEVTGTTQFGYPSATFIDGSPSRPPQLGSGIFFNDEPAGMKELAANAHRVEAWRKTSSYKYCVMDFSKTQTTSPIQGFDVVHQMFRLRHGKMMQDSEVSLIIRTISENVKTYEQVVELLSYLSPHSGGLLQLGFGLFHQKESIRETTVDIFNQLRAYPVGVLFLQALNHFQRYAYVRQAHAKEKRSLEPQQHPQTQPQSQSQLYPPPAFGTRSFSNPSVLAGHGERSNGAF